MTDTFPATYDHLTAGELAAQLIARADSADRKYFLAGGSTVAPGTVLLRAAAAKLLDAATLEYRVVDDRDRQEHPPKRQSATRESCGAYLASLTFDAYEMGHLRIQARRPATDWRDVPA